MESGTLVTQQKTDTDREFSRRVMLKSWRVLLINPGKEQLILLILFWASLFNLYSIVKGSDFKELDYDDQLII